MRVTFLHSSPNKKLNAYNVEFISIILVRDRFVEIYPLDDSQIDEEFIQINIRYILFESFL